jgi:uncharacterized repeat protein (TIGR04138 family)
MKRISEDARHHSRRCYELNASTTNPAGFVPVVVFDRPWRKILAHDESAAPSLPSPDSLTGMQAVNFEEALERILERDTRYHHHAYLFLREALDHTHKLLGKADKDVIHHVSGRELLTGIREYALQQFGPMAMMVLAEWGINRCEDWGEIVFIMVEHNLLAKTEQDSLNDFKGSYDFFEAFRQPFLPSQPKTVEPLPEAKSQA